MSLGQFQAQCRWEIRMNLRATLGGLLAIVLWSTSVALARSVSRQLGPLSAAAVVYTFGGAVGLGWSLVRQPVCWSSEFL